jgi:molybdopterin-guanine dinucleotide biosynthesis protein A
LSVTFEEGTWAAWLYDLLKPHVARVVVCNPRKNALITLAGMGTLSEGFERFVIAPLLPRRLRVMLHTV